MSTILSTTIVENAKSSVDTYKSEVSGLNDQLAEIINKLRSTNFIGDASDGYNTFYTNTVLPKITDELTQYMDQINSVLDTIKQQLLDTMDPQLGESNQSAGAVAAG